MSLPAPARWIGLASVASLSVAVLFAIVYLVIGYVKLAVSPRVSLRSLRELDERTTTRAAARRQSALATSRIEQFLAAYPLDARGLEELKRLGAGSDQLQQLTKSRARLLREHQSLSGGANWLHDIDKDFLRMLDDIASRRIKLTAKKVGIATAAAPTGFIDSGIVAVNGFLLVGDLCRIYNLRSDRWSTILILGHLLINLFAAGNMEGVTEGVGDGVADAVADSAGFGIAATAGLASARAAEGTANGLLTWRLGRVAMRRLRPIGL